MREKTKKAQFKTIIITDLERLKVKQANAAQRRWMRDVAKFIDDVGLGGLYGPEFEGRNDFQLHHVLGRSAKHNKVPIGHWFIIPVPVELHDVGSDHPDNVTHFKKNFVKRFGDQCGIFQILYSCMAEWNKFPDCNFEIPPLSVYAAIMDTRV